MHIFPGEEMKTLSLVRSLLIITAFVLGGYVVYAVFDMKRTYSESERIMRESTTWFGNRTEADMSRLAVSLHRFFEDTSVENSEWVRRNADVVWSELRSWRENRYFSSIVKEVGAEELLLDTQAFLERYDAIFRHPIGHSAEEIEPVSRQIDDLLQRYTRFSFDLQAYEEWFFVDLRQRIEAAHWRSYQIGFFALMLIALAALLGNYQFRKMEEANLRVKSLVDATNKSAQPIFIAVGNDGDYRIEFVNHSMADIIGVSAEHSAGQSLQTLLQDHAKMDVEWLNAKRDTQDWREEVDVQVVTSSTDFEPHWYHLSVASRKHDAKGVNVLYGALIDMHERKKSEQELQRAARLADQSSREKSRFVSVVSHELRTPLNALNLALELAHDERDNTKQANYLNQAMEALHTLRMHTDVVTRYADLDEKDFVLRYQVFDLLGLVQAIVQNSACRLDERGLDVRIDDQDFSHTLLYGDETHIHQILLQIFDNAIKFSEDGEIEFRLVSDKVNNELLAVRICCSDCGPGIDAEILPTIFDGFNKETPGVGNGIGIGLSNSRRLAQKMGGDITVDSEVGVGTTITLELVMEVRQEYDEIAGAPDLDWHALNCLVVDDSEPNRRLLCAMLARNGATAESAPGGEEALALMESNSFNLALVDLYMPSMQGDELIEIVRNSALEARDIPIIVVTATADSASLNRALDAGANDILSKPFSQEELTAIIYKNMPLEVDHT